MASNKKFAAPVKSAEEMEKHMKDSFHGILGQHCLLMGQYIGLLDVLSKFDKPATSQEIADAGNCKERYVREWLYGMVVSGFLSVQEDEELFFLHPDHRKIVCSDSPWVTLASMRSLQPAITKEVTEVFKKEGPLGTVQMDIDYQLPDHFLAKLQDQLHTWDAFKTSVIDKIPGFLEKLEKGCEVLEVGCNRARSLTMMAEKFPNSKFMGNDVDKPSVDWATENAKSLKLNNLNVVVDDLYNMPDEYNNKFDVAFCICTIHDLPYVTKCVSAMKRTIKPDGYISIIDLGTPGNLQSNINNPKFAVLLGLSMFYCLPWGMSFEGSDQVGTAWTVDRARHLIEKGGVDILFDEPVFQIEIFRHYLCKPKKD